MSTYSNAKPQMLRIRQNYTINTKVKVKSVFNILFTFFLFGGAVYLLKECIIPFFNAESMNRILSAIYKSDIAEFVNEYFNLIIPDTNRISKILPINTNFAIDSVRLLVIATVISTLVFLFFNIINSLTCIIYDTIHKRRNINNFVFVATDLTSAIVSYTSLALYFVTACYLATIFPIIVFDFNGKIWPYAIIWCISTIVFVLAIIKFIKVKRERLKYLRDLRENLFTYFLGVFICMLPFIASVMVSAILAITIVILLILFLIAFLGGLGTETSRRI